MAAPATAPWLWVGCGDGWAAALRLPPHPGEGKKERYCQIGIGVLRLSKLERWGHNWHNTKICAGWWWFKHTCGYPPISANWFAIIYKSTLWSLPSSSSFRDDRRLSGATAPLWMGGTSQVKALFETSDLLILWKIMKDLLSWSRFLYSFTNSSLSSAAVPKVSQEQVNSDGQHVQLIYHGLW